MRAPTPHADPNTRCSRDARLSYKMSPRDVADVADGCRQFSAQISTTDSLAPVFARVSQQDQVIMQSGSQALATLRSHVPPLLRCMCDESLIPHVT